MSGRRYVHDSILQNRRAPERVVPWVIARHRPHTIIDVGCGIGTWTSVFIEHGCDAIGLDGEDISDELLVIPRDRFHVMDFERGIDFSGSFDLAVCLEVAEHLTPSAGQKLVTFLTGAADVVLFSAAIPQQGGQNHLNEQWPAYWQGLFAAAGYACSDEIRWAFWDDEAVEWWYRQNMFIATRGGEPTKPLASVVHPAFFAAALHEAQAQRQKVLNDVYEGRVTVRTGASVFARTLAFALRRRVRRLVRERR